MLLSNKWTLYETIINKDYATVTINLDAKKNFHKRFPKCLIMNIKYKAVKPGEFPIKSEFEILNFFDDKAREIVGKDGVIPVFITNTIGERRLTIFTDDVKKMKDKLFNTLITLKNKDKMEIEKRISFTIPKNNDWFWYDYVYPDELDLINARTRNFLQKLYEMGDDFSLVRPVNFVSIFKDRKDSLKYLNYKENKGYKLVKNQTTDDGLYIIEIATSSSIERSTIDSMVQEVYETTKAFGGIYKGWGTNVANK